MRGDPSLGRSRGGARQGSVACLEGSGADGRASRRPALDPRQVVGALLGSLLDESAIVEHRVRSRPDTDGEQLDVSLHAGAGSLEAPAGQESRRRAASGRPDRGHEQLPLRASARRQRRAVRDFGFGAVRWSISRSASHRLASLLLAVSSSIHSSWITPRERSGNSGAF